MKSHRRLSMLDESENLLIINFPSENYPRLGFLLLPESSQIIPKVPLRKESERNLKKSAVSC